MVVVNQHAWAGFVTASLSIQSHQPLVVLALNGMNLIWILHGLDFGNLRDLLGFRPAILRVVPFLAALVALDVLSFAFGLGLPFS